MSNCETCQKTRMWVLHVVVYNLQLFLRTLSGSKRWFAHHAQTINGLIEAGASLESEFMEHEQATAAWLMKLEERVGWLEQQNLQLRQRVQELQSAEKS